MRTYEEKKKILELHEEGFNKSQISKLTAIPRGTVRDIIKRYNGYVSQLAEEVDSKSTCWGFESLRSYQLKSYSYLLGMYLGDGYIVKEPRTYKLRVFLDKKYPLVIEKVKSSMNDIFPQNKVGMVYYSGHVEVNFYSKGIIRLFPQYGLGKKHERDVSLSEEQREIVKKYPWDFLNGLLHSDGSRDENYSSKYKKKTYARYLFTNKSQDICESFRFICNLLEIEFKEHSKRKDDIRIFSIAKKEFVKKIDKNGGKKY